MLKPEYHPETFFHWTEINVRFRDLDPLNHVNNAVFNTYFEEARIDFIHHVPEFRESMETGISFVLVHLEMSYIKPIFHPETILVGSSVLEYGNSSVKGYQAIYSKKGHELKAVTQTTGVLFDVEKQRPVRLPNIENRDQYLFKPVTDG